MQSFPCPRSKDTQVMLDIPGLRVTRKPVCVEVEAESGYEVHVFHKTLVVLRPVEFQAPELKEAEAGDVQQVCHDASSATWLSSILYPGQNKVWYYLGINDFNSVNNMYFNLGANA